MHTLDDNPSMDNKLYDVREAFGEFAANPSELHAGMAANAVDAYVEARGAPPPLDTVDHHRLDAMRRSTSAKVQEALARILQRLQERSAIAA